MRQSGWYWTKFNENCPWEAMRWDCDREEWDGIEPETIGPRIPSPDEPWKVVPVEPTDEMSRALCVSSGTDAPAKDPIGFWVKAHKRMLAAAPKP